MLVRLRNCAKEIIYHSKLEEKGYDHFSGGFWRKNPNQGLSNHWPSCSVGVHEEKVHTRKETKSYPRGSCCIPSGPDFIPYLPEMGWTPLGRAAITLLSSQHPTVHTDISVWWRWRSLRESQAGSPPSAAGPPWLTFLRSCSLAGIGSRASCASGDRPNKHCGSAIAFMLWPRSAISPNAISCR